MVLYIPGGAGFLSSTVYVYVCICVATIFFLYPFAGFWPLRHPHAIFFSSPGNKTLEVGRDPDMLGR